MLIISELESDSVSESINSSLLGFIGVFRLSCFVRVISGSDEADSEVELGFALPPRISGLTGIVVELESSETASALTSALTVVVPELLEEVSLVMAVEEAGEELLAILLARLGNISCCFLVN